MVITVNPDMTGLNTSSHSVCSIHVSRPQTDSKTQLPEWATNDRKHLYRTNYEAMKLAISRAMTLSLSIKELIANRHTISHEMYDPETGESQW